MLISVVIPVFNSGKTALLSAKSVIEQSDDYQYEIILVDDCSQDDSVNYLKEHLQPSTNVSIKYVLQTFNQGSGASRNAGIKEVSGLYFGLLDSDDRWLPGKLKLQVDFLESHPDYAMIGTLTNMPGSFTPPFSSGKEYIDVSAAQQCFKNFFQTSTVLIRTAMFKKSVEWPMIRYGDEGDAFLRLAAQYRISLINKVLLNYSDGKRGFGKSGVSKKIQEMQAAEIKNLKMAYRNKYINLPTFGLALTLSYAKYARRVLITKLRNKFS